MGRIVVIINNTEFCLRTNTNWHSLRIAQHRIDSNYFVLVHCHFRITSLANTNVLKCSKHSYWPCESKPILLRRIASPNIVSIRVSSYRFVSHRCIFVSIRCTFALGFAACLLRLSTLQYDAQRSHYRIGSHMFALVRVSSYEFLSCSHHIIAQSYRFSITTVLLRIASCRHRVRVAIVLHLIASHCMVSIRVKFVSDSHWFANNHRIKSFWFGIEVDPVRTPNF